MCDMDVASTVVPGNRDLRSEQMGRQVDSEDLVSAVEIAQRLGGRRPQVVYDWRRRHADFPAPLTKVGAVHVWNWPDVEAWARKTGRL